MEGDGGQQNSTRPGWMVAWMHDSHQGIPAIQSEIEKAQIKQDRKFSKGHNVEHQWPSNNHSDSPAARPVSDAPRQPPADDTPPIHHEACQTKKLGWEYECVGLECTPVHRSSACSCHRYGRHRHACSSHYWRSCKYQGCSRWSARRGAGRR